MDAQALARELGRIDVFRGADDGTLTELARRSRVDTYDEGAGLIDQHDEDTDLFAILTGAVRITLLSPRGQEVSFRDQEAGSAFGLLSAIDGRPRSASAVALVRTRAAVVTGAALKAAMARSPAVMEAVTNHLAFLVRELSERVFEFSTLVARQRVQAELLRLAERAERRDDGSVLIRPAPTHAAIATRISTQRETVSREMSVLARMGLVERRGNGLLVRDVEALAGLVDSARSLES